MTATELLLFFNPTLKVTYKTSRIPKKTYDTYIIMNVYKTAGKLSAHYVFGYYDDERFITYNLDRRYSNINDYLIKNDTIGSLFILYGINKM